MKGVVTGMDTDGTMTKMLMITWVRLPLCKVWQLQGRGRGRGLSSLDLLLVQCSYTHRFTSTVYTLVYLCILMSYFSCKACFSLLLAYLYTHFLEYSFSFALHFLSLATLLKLQYTIFQCVVCTVIFVANV